MNGLPALAWLNDLVLGHRDSVDARIAAYDEETQAEVHRVVNLFLKTIGPPPGSILDLRSRAPDDPVFAAIERHRQAMRTRPAEHDDDARDRLLAAEGDAFVEWLTTPPTTMAGVIATLDHAAANYSDGFDSYYCRGDGDLSDVVAAGEQFPAMIAAALRQIVADKSP